jgi:phenylacetate-coenzyme A ligase PaaK-like adenylate-forming protein
MVDGKYWNQKIETMPRADMQKYQLQKLKEIVKHTAMKTAAFTAKNSIASA